MSAAFSGKGEKYLAQLDQTLCSGNWSEVPEIARKTDKHAPERKCFTLAARTEAQIASASHRPTSAASTTASSIHGLGEVIPQLKEAIANAETQFFEDAFAARVCLAEIQWLRDEKDAVLKTLSDNAHASKEAGSHAPTLGWLEVCEAKAAYLRAATLQSGGKSDDARSAYIEAMRKAPGTRCAELRRWTERVLASGCMFVNEQATSPSIYTLSESLRCFQKWSDFWQRSPPPTTQSSTHLDIPRRRVWRAYFDLLSSILSYDLIYNPSSTGPSLLQSSEHLSDGQYTSAKSGQRAAMKRVESTYESLLLNETQFPKASQTNTEVETFAEQVVSNWRIFCGHNWTDAEFGEGGKDRLGHDVLDILYRAATKTFHSTAILRHLFTVHAALGEFELAMHAWDSYEEIVSKGKARAEKTGKHETGFDDDDTTVLTAIDAARVLCRYGDCEQGEKAMEVAKVIQKWAKLDGTADQDGKGLKPKTLSTAHRMIGICHANHARLAYDSNARSGLRSEALSHFRQAMEFDENDLETAYDLAMIRAEMRDVDAATTVLRRALSSQATEDDDEEKDDEDLSGFEREQKLVPLWHLLALCLTAKDEHEQAVKMCGAAFEQFGDAALLFGEANTRSSMESSQSMSRISRGLVDQMDGYQKENMLQVKTTQLMLLELMEGAEAAVDVSHELLSLYTRLFGNPEKLKPAAQPPATGVSVPPSKTGGTLRSLAGSIRPKSTRQSLEKGRYANGSLASLPEGRTAERTNETESANRGAIGVPIAITVTNEMGEKAHDHRLPFKLRGSRGDWREHGNLKPSESSKSLREKPAEPVTSEKSDEVDHATKTTPIQPAVDQSHASENPANPEQPLKEMEHNAPHDAWPPPPGHDEHPPRQDVRLPAPHPTSAYATTTRFSSSQERQHKISVLVGIWLFIAGLYLRASLLDDSSGAIMEAHKLVELAEADATAADANARKLYEKSWGGGRSVDRLWADVWAAKAQLASARDQPFRALEAYEQSVAYYPDHPDGIIGLSNILMDIYEEKIPIEEPRPILPNASANGRNSIPPRPSLISIPVSPPEEKDSKPRSLNRDPTPDELNRLAARDRAYMLLTTLTRLGSGWDHSEAWYTLARAHELSKQIEKAKKALWWVVELEENQPVRPWREAGCGGLTL